MGAHPSHRADQQPQTRQERIQARLEAIRIRRQNLPPNPVAEDEARRLGEREPATVDEAADTLAAVLPVASRETWMRQADGTWLCRETGCLEDHCPV